jgi:hypothetical protein
MTAYADLVRASLDRPFQWGVHDCVTFAFAAVKVRTGRDRLGLTPTWRTAIEAHRVIEAMGGLRKAVSERLGEPVGVLQAGLGDPVLVRDPDNGREVMGVCHGEVLLCPSERGLAMLPHSAAICAWRVK